MCKKRGRGFAPNVMDARPGEVEGGREEPHKRLRPAREGAGGGRTAGEMAQKDPLGGTKGFVREKGSINEGVAGPREGAGGRKRRREEPKGDG